jgi:general secretion pathway protein A
MYKNFFGLHENPFNINPDPRFLYLAPQTQESLDQLTYGIQNRKGFLLLTGEVGTGKTTLINYLLDWLRQQKMPTAFIFNSHLSVNHLFDFILNDFGIPIDFRLKSNMLLQLNTWLIHRFRAGETPVLIVDEAQGLSFDLLEEIRLLLNLETASEKLLQIVLVGQLELEEKLKRPELRQLRQRIALRCNTAPLTLEESCAYIAGRLRIGGATGDPIFASDAMEAVYFYSRGIPRVMNLLCERALINAYVEQLNPVPAQMVQEAARDFLLDEFRPVTPRLSVGKNTNSNLTVMQSMVANEWERPAAAGEASLHEPPHATWSPAPAALAAEESMLTAENSFATTLSKSGEAAQRENLNVSICMGALGPTMAGVEPVQNERDHSLESMASDSDSAAELIATMKRILAAASPVPPPHLVPPRGGNEPSSVPKNTRVFASGNRALTLDTMNRIPCNSRGTQVPALFSSLETWRTFCEIVLMSVVSPAAWSRMSAAVVRSIRQPIHLAPVVQHWLFEFRRDWISMMNAMGLAQMKTSVLHWLRQPLSSKPMASSKN